MRLCDVYWTIRRGFPLRSLLACDLNPHALPASTWIPHPYGITVQENVIVGENCLISPNVCIGAVKLHYRYENTTWLGNNRETVIGDRVLLGTGCVIAAGVHIANDCVIGAGAVVTRDVTKTHSVVYGVPAKVVNYHE